MRITPLYGYLYGLLGTLFLLFPGESIHVQPTIMQVYSNAYFETSVLNNTHQKQQDLFNGVSGVMVKTSIPDSFSHSIPLRRIGRLFVIEATIDGESGNLIFDTGATTLVLNRTYFRDHVTAGEVISSGLTGNLSQIDKITANILTIGDIDFQRIPAHLADLGHIENQRGIKVLGLFGFELIKSFEITFDVVNNRIELRPIDKKGNLLVTGKSFQADFTQKFETSNNVIFIDAEVGEKLLRFCFDTGAETNALSSDLQKSILQTVSITRSIKVKGSGSVSREVIYGRMNSFQYGNILIPDMETIVTYMDHLNEAYGIHIDGVLGFDFISKGNFCFNFVKKQIGISFLIKPGQ